LINIQNDFFKGQGLSEENGIYGIAAVMNHEVKNNMYNVLDIFAKNFFGLYLCYRISNIVTISK
jgi:bacteriorhodopsin